MAISVRRIQPGDAGPLRRTRLAALADTPSAFASTYEAELTNTDDRWTALALERSDGGDHATFFAVEEAGEIVGLVGGHRTDADTVDLVSMWTDPIARGRGVGSLLVEAVVGWADGSTIELWVTRGNDAAERLYERLGFAVTGEVAPLPSDPCKDEIRMRRATEE